MQSLYRGSKSSHVFAQTQAISQSTKFRPMKGFESDDEFASDDMDENRAVATDGKAQKPIQKQLEKTANQFNATTTVGVDSALNGSYYYNQTNISPVRTQVVSNFYKNNNNYGFNKSPLLNKKTISTIYNQTDTNISLTEQPSQFLKFSGANNFGSHKISQDQPSIVIPQQTQTRQQTRNSGYISQPKVLNTQPAKSPLASMTKAHLILNKEKVIGDSRNSVQFPQAKMTFSPKSRKGIPIKYSMQQQLQLISYQPQRKKTSKNIKARKFSNLSGSTADHESKIMRIVRARMQQEREANPELETTLMSDQLKTMQHKLLSLRDTKATPQKVIKGDDDMALLNYNSNNDDDFDSPINRKSMRNTMSATRIGKDSVTRRLIDDNNRRKESRERLELQKKEKEEKEMPTFQPVLITQERSNSNSNRQNNSGSRKRQPKRKFNTFYQDQMDYKLKIENQVRTKREEEEISAFVQAKYAHVKANKKSDKILEKLKSTAITQAQQTIDDKKVHERLHHNIPIANAGKRNKTNSLSDVQNRSILRKKKISIQAQQQQMERLFIASQQREVKMKQLQDKWDSINTMVTSTTKKEINNRYVFEKLKKDFANFFNKEGFYSEGSATPKSSFQRSPMHSSKNQSALSPKFSKIDETLTMKTGKNTQDIMRKGTPMKLKNYIKLMHVLGFIHVKNRSNVEEEMLTECWKLLGGTNDSTVKAENLFVVLSAIMNIQLPDIVYKHDDQTNDHQKEGRLCYDQYGNVHFTSYDDVTKIHLKFKQLSINRMSKKREVSQQSKSGNTSFTSHRDQSFSASRQPFTPTIDARSKSIAELKFKKLQEQQNNIKHHDYLLNLGKKKEQLRNQLKQELFKQEEGQCTFRPDTSRSSSIKRRSSERSRSNSSINKNSSFLKQLPGKSPVRGIVKDVTNSQDEDSIIIMNLKKSPYSKQPGQSQNLNLNLSQLQSNKDLIEVNQGELSQTRPSRRNIVEMANQNLSISKSHHNLNIASQNQDLSQPSQHSKSDSSEIDVISRIGKNEDLNKSSGSINSSRFEKKSPLLFVDVNLGKEKGMQRIVLYEEDQPSLIADKFSQQHGLTENKTNKLAVMLGQKMEEHRKKLQVVQPQNPENSN